VTLAAETRDAAREHPFLHEALRAGVVNYTAAARYLDLEGDVEAAATALRRYAESLDRGGDSASETTGDDATGSANVTMHRGAGIADAAEDAVVTVGDAGLVPGQGSLTAILATGAVDARTLEGVLGRLRIADVSVSAAGLAGESLAVAVPDRKAATALRVVEECV
jgi:uncharacterized protein with beta-barrel porin domain